MVGCFVVGCVLVGSLVVGCVLEWGLLVGCVLERRLLVLINMGSARAFPTRLSSVNDGAN